MNILDMLAIAPYWISLFILDDTPEAVVEEETVAGVEDSDKDNEDDTTFGSVSRIMQVE